MDKSIVALSELLNLESEIVKASLEDDSLAARIEDFKSKSKIYTDDTLAKLKENLKKEAVASYENDLVDRAKSGDLPSEVYKIIKGSTREMTEKELSKKYGVVDYNNLGDLIDKIANQGQGKGDDERVADLEAKLNELKEANKKLVSERDNAVTEADNKVKEYKLNDTLEKSLNSIPFDLSDVSDEEKEAVTERQKRIVKSLFTDDYKASLEEDKVYVSKGDNKLLDEATHEPVPVVDVLQKVAREVGFRLQSPEKGGLGGTSSKTTGGMTVEAAKAKLAQMEDGSIEHISFQRKIKTEYPEIAEKLKNG